MVLEEFHASVTGVISEVSQWFVYAYDACFRSPVFQ